MNWRTAGRQNRLNFVEDLIENLPIAMMILDKNGHIIRINKKQEQLSQIEREKILGRTFHETFPKTLKQGLKKPYFNLLKYGTPYDVLIDQYIPQFYSRDVTYHGRGASFSSKKYFVLLNENEDELYHFKRLVEKRTRELHESKNFLESLIDSSPNIVISTDLNGRIIIFNKTAEKIFGYTKEEVMKRKIRFLFKENSVNEEMEKKQLYSTKEVSCVTKSGNIFVASFLTSNIKNNYGKSIAKLYLLSDLTEKKEMEERLYISEKLALYSELLGGIAHQLNNPLIGVVNFSEMLLKEMEDEDPKRELAETVSRAGRECLKIITSVLSCIKDPSLTFTKTNINEVLMDSVQSLKEQFRERLRKISIRTKMNQKILPILGDSIQLKQCFLNILTNAVQSMTNGGNLRIESKYIDGKEWVQVIFSDRGIGIPKEYMNKIFLPFFSLKKSADSHGFGLSFAYQIVKNHGGRIAIESKVGLGSTFTIILPTNDKNGQSS